MTARFALLLALVAAPALAAPGGVEASLTPVLVAGPAQSIHQYVFTATVGAALVAELAWESPTADLDLLLIRPANGCDVASPDCLLGPDGPVDGARCPVVEDEVADVRLGFGAATARVATAARADGRHEVWVVASIAPPGIPIAYTLALTADGATPGDLVGPTDSTAIIGSPHCKEWWAAQELAGGEPGAIVGR